MGMVFEAVNDSVGGRAAIKVLRSEVSSRPDITARFFNEARAANSVSHPGIVRIFDCGYAQGGIAFLAMEFLEGESLRARLERLGRLTVLDSLRISLQIASALRAAHQRLVAHRDLKPDNIMLVKDPDLPGGERIKVLDFGIAKMSEGAYGHRTRSNVLMGTPLYMAPEQCHGAKLVTEKSDVYALGVILYQMLSGRPPFIGEGFGELAAMHLKEPPPPLVELAPHVPLQVAAFVHVLLDKFETSRPTMDEAHRQLMRLMTKLSESPTGPPRLMSSSDDISAAASDEGVPPPALAEPHTGPQDVSAEPDRSPQDDGSINARETVPISVAALRQRLKAKASSGAGPDVKAAQQSDGIAFPGVLRVSPFTPIDHMEPLSVAPSTAPTARQPVLRQENVFAPQQPVGQGNQTITGTASELRRPLRSGHLAMLLAGVIAAAGIGGWVWLSNRNVRERSPATPILTKDNSQPPPRDPDPRKPNNPILIINRPVENIADMGDVSDASADNADASVIVRGKNQLSKVDYLVNRSAASFRNGEYEESLKRALACKELDGDKYQCWWLVGMNACNLSKIDLVTLAFDLLQALKEEELADEVASECRKRWIYRGADQKFHLPASKDHSRSSPADETSNKLKELPLKPFPYRKP